MTATRGRGGSHAAPRGYPRLQPVRGQSAVRHLPLSAAHQRHRAAYLQDSEAEVLGVPTRPDSRRLDPDLGRYALTALEPLRHAFKTPTLRNVALTAPYMHNGQYQTLEEVLDFYNQGGGLAGPGGR
ncbi:MAG: hypothetical protein WKG07_06905 [Hymenobacter sp.]